MSKLRSTIAGASAVLVMAGLVPAALLTSTAHAEQAPVGQGFTVTPSDLKFILAQIKIAEHHAATLTPANPCGTLVGTGPDQIESPLISKGLRTVDGSCNNLQPGQETFGAADQKFPRLSSKSFRPAQGAPAGFFGPGIPVPASSSYDQLKGNVFDTEPRVISNLIVDQTSTNPAAVVAAGKPVRTQGNEGVKPCTTDPSPAFPTGDPANCVASHHTLFIPNVTTDVGLSPPYNSLFTLFGQFFDHGVDQTVKGGGTVFVPLKGDDPLIAGPNHVIEDNPATPATEGDDLPPSQRFMVLTRAQNQPGPDGIVGDPNPAAPDTSLDDVQDASNTDSPWVDQSQTYTSHSSHQVFLREYENNDVNRPIATGKLLGGPAGNQAGGMATWATTKKQASELLGIQLLDKDVLNVPMLAADPYGKFTPGPARGLPQFVTRTGLVEANRTDNGGLGTLVPANVLYFDTPFLTDIAHNADPSPQDTDHNPGTAPVAPTKDADNTASADFAHQPPGTYDDEMLDAHFIAGDGRVNENIGLTTIHQVFHSEHDRLIDYIENVLKGDTSASGVAALAQWKLADGAGPDSWNGERLFQAARFVTEMEYQHLVFEEFARKVQPAINPFEPFAFTQTEINPAIKAEFAHAVYRFGHSMLTETIDRRNEDGSKNDISLLEGFLNPPSYTDGGPDGPKNPDGSRKPLTSEEAAGSIVMGMSDQAGNELDEFVTETLRNNLLGLPLDLATINMARARSEGIPPLNVFRRDLFKATNDGQLKPYTNWIDFGEHLKHPESLVNFVAAYGTHPSITAATTVADKREAARLIVSPNPLADPPDVSPSDAAEFMNGPAATSGLDKVDLWVGGLAEVTNVFGGLLGSTFNYVFENQMTDLQNGDRLYYLARTPGMNLRTQLEGNSFAEMIMRNTNAKSLKADAFATADCKFELKNLAGTKADFDIKGNTVADDVASECDESAVLIRMSDGTIKYRNRNSVDPSGINGQSVYNGTAGVDRVSGGNDSDTFWGGLGNDVIEGGDGADVALGGEGNDIITDSNGDDVPKGGPGNDAIDAGPGLDIVMGGEGKDFTNGGANANETFGGEGDDFIMLGQSLDAAFGDSGDDFEEGGDQPDLMQGDSGNLFFQDDSQTPGSDILVGQGGDDDYDMEGGDDIGVGGPGIEKVAGASGYDWEIGLGDPQPQDMDLSIPLIPLDILQVGVRDKFNEVEALSGGDLNDTLRGDDVVPNAAGGGGFIGCNVLDAAGVARIRNLNTLVTTLPTPLQSVVDASAAKDCPILSGPVWGEGNILLGGSGSDLIEGRGANDIIDGDRYLNVRLSVRNDAGVEIGSASVNQPGQSAMTSQYLRNASGALTGPTLQEAVFAGTVDPGNIVAVREILTGSGGTDTAVFSDVRAAYQCSVNGGALGPCALTSNGAVTTVVHAAGAGADGTDTIRNIERLQFSDSVPPAAPLIGIAVRGNASATVNWTEPAGAVTGSEVEVQTTAGAVVGALRPAAAGVTSLVVTGLTNGTAYRFRVRSTNESGTGAFSAFSNTVTPATVPGAPTIGTAAAGNTNATVTWTGPANNGGSAITGFNVQVVNPAGAQVGALRPAAAGTTSLLVTGLSNGTNYRFRVQAVNDVGSSVASALSNTVTPAAPPPTGVVPGAPAIRNAVSGVAGGAVTATANWRATTAGSSAITSYRVTATPVGVGTAVTQTQAAVPGLDQSRVMTLQPGLYRFTVVAVNAAGAGPASAASNVVIAR